MTEQELEKALFISLDKLPNNKRRMLHDFGVELENQTNESLDENIDALKVVADRLEKKKYAFFSEVGGGMYTITPGLNFEEWRNEIIPKPIDSVTIGSITAEQVQVGDGNTQNINVTPEAFVEAIENLAADSEKTTPLIHRLREMLKDGATVAQIAAAVIAFAGS